MEDYGTKLKREEMCDDVMRCAEGSGSKAPRCTYGDLAETPRFWAPASMQNASINAIRKPFQIGVKDISSTQFRPYWPLLIYWLCAEQIHLVFWTGVLEQFDMENKSYSEIWMPIF